MATLQLPIFSLFLLTLLTSPSPSLSATCSSPKLTNPNLYKNCDDLPTLNSTLHWTYTPSNKTLTVAFTAPPGSHTGWVAWAINPTGSGMAGAQALLAFKNPNGSMAVKTFNITSYSDISEGKLAFDVYEKRAEFNAGDESITIFAAVEAAAPAGEGKVNQVWQVGPGVKQGFPQKHEFKPGNLQAKGTLDLNSAAGGRKNGLSGDSSFGAGEVMRMRNVRFVLLGLVFGTFSVVGCY